MKNNETLNWITELDTSPFASQRQRTSWFNISDLIQFNSWCPGFARCFKEHMEKQVSAPVLY